MTEGPVNGRIMSQPHLKTDGDAAIGAAVPLRPWTQGAAPKIQPLHTGAARHRCGWRAPPHARSRAARAVQAAASFPWDVAELLRRAGPAEPLPMGGALLRGALRPPEARWLCAEMLRLRRVAQPPWAPTRRAGGADAAPAADRRPRELVSWCHPFSRESTSSERPSALLHWAEGLLHALAPSASSAVVESLLAQVYAAGGSLLPHTDVDLSWGLGVSLGADSIFECLPDGDGVAPATVRLRSGDVIAANFGRMRHAVRVPRDAPTPEWWRAAAADVADAGAVRCNLLFRQPLSEEELLSKAEARAQKLYGTDVRSLAEREGIRVTQLCVQLRHVAVE